MSTVLFDFDSTIITREGLEEILKAKLAGNEALERKVEALTEQGMDGHLSFQESLSLRLRLAEPGLADVKRFGEAALDLLTPGMDELIAWLHAQDVAVHIVSGGLAEAILPVAKELSIPENRVHAVRLSWGKDGEYLGIDPKDLFSIAKYRGVEPLIGAWPPPRIAVGDGMTDYQLWHHRLVDVFIAFTQNVRRGSVLEKGVPEARNVDALRAILEKWL